MTNFKRKFKKIISGALVCLVLAVGSASIHQNAKAWWTDPFLHCCGETILLGMILGIMEFNDMLIYEYLILGGGDVGTGIVGTISANAQSQMSHNEIASNGQAIDNQNLREATGEFIVAEHNNQTFGDPRECSTEALNSQLGGRLGVSDAAAASANRAAKMHAALDLAMAQAPSESSSAGAMLVKHNSLYCNAIEAAKGTCSTGSMPDADIKAHSLFSPAGPGATASASGNLYSLAPPSAAPNLTITFNEQQAAAATDAVINILGRFSPPILPKAVADTPAGRMYTAKYKIFQARLSPAGMVLEGIAGRRAQGGATGPALDGWNAIKGEYSDIFPGSTAPSDPSEAELLRYEVARRFAGSDYMASLRRSNSTAGVLTDVAQNDAVELKILFDMHTRIEEDNALLSAVLSQLTNPISKSEVIDSSTGAFRSKQ